MLPAAQACGMLAPRYCTGKRAGLARQAGVQLRQPVAGEVARRLEHVPRHAGALVGEAVALEAERNQRVVVRPDRAAVVRVRVVRADGRTAACECPSRSRSSAASGAARPAPRGRARSSPLHRQWPTFDAIVAIGLLVGIEAERVEAQVLAPERVLEALLQLRRRRAQRRARGRARRARRRPRPCACAASKT